MPFALLFIGLICIIAAVRNKQDDLFTLLKSDFTGDKNFFVWVVAIIVIVAIGNVKTLRPVSNAFLGLVILVIVLTNGKNGLFANFISQVREGTSGNASGIVPGLGTGSLDALANSAQNYLGQLGG